MEDNRSHEYIFSRMLYTKSREELIEYYNKYLYTKEKTLTDSLEFLSKFYLENDNPVMSKEILSLCQDLKNDKISYEELCMKFNLDP